MLTKRDSFRLTREVSVRITRKSGGCSDGPCPAILDTDDPEVVAFQGAILTDPQALADVGDVPAHEAVVLLPRSLVEGYVAGLSDDELRAMVDDYLRRRP